MFLFLISFIVNFLFWLRAMDYKLAIYQFTKHIDLFIVLSYIVLCRLFGQLSVFAISG